ncbi:unnamed protein product [Rhizophagus irregularis]|uniref:Uncharacterized protein n=1 Tax=Rhizophagus irregularis TaxID=588596 RepID=A0A2I1HPD2_9GLOM|nr:hypothetical protein RhiirA4_484802 [Rhizophagus irregularis]CAB4410055.1 unnamed protein product [Rhizophagus irregularis]
MENVHTIWDSSTIGKGKKLGISPNDRYSNNNNTKQSKDISLTQKLVVAIDNGLYLLDKCTELCNTCNKLTKENTQLRNRLDQSIISSKKLTETTLRAEHEANLITSKKEIDMLSLRLKELESALLSKITEIYSLEMELSSKTMELQKCEAEFSSKSFNLQTAKTECGVYKQHVSDMAEQSSLKKYQMSILLPEKQNKKMLGVVSLNYPLIHLNVIQ